MGDKRAYENWWMTRDRWMSEKTGVIEMNRWSRVMVGQINEW